MTTTTFATLRALHALMGDALDDIHRVFSQSSSPPSSQCSSPLYPASPEPVSMPPTPMSSTFSTQASSYGAPLSPMFDHDYPSPTLPYVPSSPAEQLAAHPDASAAATKIIAAAGQITNIVQKPFLFICDATMGYNLPASMRLLEHLHIVEILREAEDQRQRIISDLDMEFTDANDDSHPSGKNIAPNAPEKTIPFEGVHVREIARIIKECSGGVQRIDSVRLAHPLRLLSTHHILRETAPDTFALTRVASLLDSGKSVASVFENPEKKYEDTTGIAAFVGLCTDELFKSAAYLTEAFTGVQLPSTAVVPGSTAAGHLNGDDAYTSVQNRWDDAYISCFPDDNSHTYGVLTPLQPIQAKLDGRIAEDSVVEVETLPAFNLAFNTPVPFFEWLENGGLDALGGSGIGAGRRDSEPAGVNQDHFGHVRNMSTLSMRSGHEQHKSFRLERFSQAMTGTSGWEANGAILSGFDWLSLPRGSTIVDVGGGIGSTTMTLARAFGSSCGRQESGRSDTNVLEDDDDDEDEDTVENTTFTPLSLTDSTPRKSRNGLKSFASRDELKSRPSQANLKPVPSHANLKVQSSRAELGAYKPAAVSSEDQDMQFRFIVQDRPVVVGLGLAAWRAQCPEMLESRQVVFQDHDFFLPQPALSSPNLNSHPAVFILRVVLHDWPDARARHILLNLRLSSGPETKLIIAEHVLPLACVDEGVRMAKDEHQMAEGENWTLHSVLAHLEGADSTLAPAPLLPNLGKASANPYWMDIMMDIIFNGKERTLRELCALALSSGWRIMRVTYSKGSHFGHLVCEPVDIPKDAFSILPQQRAAADSTTDFPFICTEYSEDDAHYVPMNSTEIYANNLLSPISTRSISSAILPHLPSPILERSSSRRGTSTFGSQLSLPRPDELQSGKSKSYHLRWLKARRLGVRSVVEKQKRREEGGRKANDNDDRGSVSPQQSRVWWRRAPLVVSPVAEERAGEGSASRLRSGTITPDVPPPLQSPRQYHFPTHRMTPSTQSNLPSDGRSSTPQSRRPSVASLTRKLNFSPFSRRPSVVDLASTSPRSATFDIVHTQPANQERNLRHQPSTPMMQKYHPDGERQKSIRHHPSAPHLKHGMTRAEVPPPPLPTAQTVIWDNEPFSAPLPPPKSRLLSGMNGTGPSMAAAPQPSQSILSSVPAPAPIRAPIMPTEPTSPKVKRPPRLPRRLSIPVLRRKREEDA